MTITMQGSWSVSVKSKSAAYPQRFTIAGAATGNGTYAGQVSTPPVYVTGDSWSITIQNDPGTGFTDSADRIKFPTVSAGQYRFDIESNDAWTGDMDFNDLILNCSTPQTATDFFIYGNVMTYSDPCIFNPCIRKWVVIESVIALQEALKYPVLRAPIEKLYPERIFPDIPPRGPFPDPPPFVPIVIPLHEETALPVKQAQVLRLAKLTPQPKSRKAGTEGEVASTPITVRSLPISTPEKLAVEIDRVSLGRYVDHLVPFCETEPLAGFVLRFLEYDRTNAELAGGTYAGTGTKEHLGICATDRNGNYIFRFSRSIAQFLEERDVDVALGEDEVVQVMPDVIAQVLDSVSTYGVAYESAPYWNVPLLKRIDLCIPRSQLGRPLTACQGTRAIQSIGNIRVLPGIPTEFDGEGRVTCADTSLADVPQARCAAWFSKIRLIACFLDQPTITQYTIRHRHKVGMGWSPWEFYQEPLRLYKIAIFDTEQTGPFDRNLEVIAGDPLQPAKAYDNIETDMAWAASDWFLKAVINTSGGSPPYAPTPGPVQFQIQGYDAAGMQVSGASDEITLYVDNTLPTLQIASVEMGTQTGGDCALFSQTGEPDPAKLKVRFKALQDQGFLNSYTLWVRKGNIGSIPITTTTGPMGEASGAIARSYVHASADPCNQLIGTRPPDEPLADASDFATAYIVPSSDNWLDDGQPFCTFVVNVACEMRRTNGYNTAVYDFGPTQYLLGIQQ